MPLKLQSPSSIPTEPFGPIPAVIPNRSSQLKERKTMNLTTLNPVMLADSPDRGHAESDLPPTKAPRILLALALYSTSATSAYGQSLSGQKGDTMSFFAWIVLGLIAGFIGSKIVNRRGEGILLDILLGVVGAFAGGWLFSIFGAPGVSGLNIYSLFVAVIGLVVLLVLYHVFIRRRSWYGAQRCNGYPYITAK